MASAHAIESLTPFLTNRGSGGQGVTLGAKAVSYISRGSNSALCASGFEVFVLIVEGEDLDQTTT